MAMAVTMETMLLLRLLLIVANECVQFLLRQVGVAFPIRMSHQSAARAHRLPNWAALDHLRVSKIPFIVFVAGIQILACSLIALLQSERHLDLPIGLEHPLDLDPHLLPFTGRRKVGDVVAGVDETVERISVDSRKRTKIQHSLDNCLVNTIYFGGFSGLKLGISVMRGVLICLICVIIHIDSKTIHPIFNS